MINLQFCFFVDSLQIVSGHVYKDERHATRLAMCECAII